MNKTVSGEFIKRRRTVPLARWWEQAGPEKNNCPLFLQMVFLPPFLSPAFSGAPITHILVCLILHRFLRLCFSSFFVYSVLQIG